MVYTKNGQEVLESYTYSYDKNSNIVSEAHVNNLPTSKINETKTYTYDSYGRLTETITADSTKANAKSTVSYAYDRVGNRTELTDSTGTTNYTYNGLNQLTEKIDSKGTTTYSYDGRGNQISESGPDGTLNFT
jgi:YD repeat-containing protein